MSEISRPPARLLLLASALALLAALCASPMASAAPDTFMLGDGHEGSVAVSAAAPLNHSAPLISAATSGSVALSTGPGLLGADQTATSGGSLAQTGFEVGRLVLVIQSSGLESPTASGDQTPITLSAGDVGRFELGRIAALTGDVAGGMTITLSAPLLRSFGSSGAQVVAVPEFTNVELASGGQWTANPWNGTNGGVTAFLATGTVDLEDATSRISARAAGFRGGLLHGGNAIGCTQLDGATGGGKGEGIVLGHYPGDSAINASRGNLANGGGGGNCSNAGGGGGANAGPGGTGGWAYDGNRDVGGLGGSKLTYSAFENAVFGGGGGAGDENNGNGGSGGAGGGLVFVRAQQLSGAGELTADGGPGGASAPSASGDGAGGGGAGGALYARFAGPAECSAATARGGNGGDEASTTGVHGPGGGGGGGSVLLQSNGGSCATSASNGVAGVVVNGGGGHRGSAPSSLDDPSFSGDLADVPGGGLTAPSLTVDTPPPGAHVATDTPTILGTASVDFALISVSIDGGPTQNTTAIAGGQWSTAPAAALADGLHSVTVFATAHGIASDPSTSSFTVDTTPPAAPVINSPTQNAAVPTATPTLAGTAEPGATVEVHLAGDFVGSAVASPSGAWTYTYPVALPDAVFTFNARQVDIAGNPSPFGIARDFRIDARLPTVTIHAKPAVATNTRSATFNFDADEAATFDCALDGSSLAPCSAPVALTGLADGTHTLVVRARDVSGNYSPLDSHSWTIDATPPTVVVSQNTPPAGVSPSFSFSSNESGTTYRCRVAPAAFVTCSSPFSAPTLAPGSYSFELRATDAFGNTAQQSIPFAVAPTSTPGPPISPPVPKPPVPEPTTCSTNGDIAGIPAEVSLLSARQLVRGLRFKVRSSGSVLVSLQLRNGKKLIAARVVPLQRGTRTLVIRSKRDLPKNRPLALRLSAVTLTGGKSAIDASLRLTGRTVARLTAPGSTNPGPAASALACSREPGAKKIRLTLTAPARVKASTGRLLVRARVSEYAAATLLVTQRGKVLARGSVLLKPDRFNRITAKQLKGLKLGPGAARIELRTVTAQGVWQSFKRSIRFIP